MSEFRPVKKILTKAVRRVSGADRAYKEAAHANTHLRNVEQWAQQEFAAQRAAQDQRLHQLEQRIERLEKERSALLSAANPKTSRLPDSAVKVVPISEQYFRFFNELLEMIDSREQLIENRNPRVVELLCGAAKCSRYLSGRVKEYRGYDPSAVLLEAAGEYCHNTQFEFFPLAAEKPLAEADVVLLFIEETRWSISDAPKLLQAAKEQLSPSGKLLLHVPHSFTDLTVAGWNVGDSAAQLGLHLLVPEQETGKGSYVLLALERGPNA